MKEVERAAAKKGSTFVVHSIEAPTTAGASPTRAGECGSSAGCSRQAGPCSGAGGGGGVGERQRIDLVGGEKVAVEEGGDVGGELNAHGMLLLGEDGHLNQATAPPGAPAGCRGKGGIGVK